MYVFSLCSQEDISLVLSSVPTGANYLKRMVHQIHHTLLQNASTLHKEQDNYEKFSDGGDWLLNTEKM